MLIYTVTPSDIGKTLFEALPKQYNGKPAVYTWACLKDINFQLESKHIGFSIHAVFDSAKHVSFVELQHKGA